VGIRCLLSAVGAAPLVACTCALSLLSYPSLALSFSLPAPPTLLCAALASFALVAVFQLQFVFQLERRDFPASSPRFSSRFSSYSALFASRLAASVLVFANPFACNLFVQFGKL